MKNILFYTIIFVLALIFSGCAGKKVQPEIATGPAPEIIEPVFDHAAETRRTTGSLYSDAQGSLFTANKATRVGDILTVVIYEQASAAKEAATSTGRSSSASVGIPRLFGIETSISDRNPNIDPANLLSASTNNSFDGSGRTSRQENLSATLTTRVVKVYDNGNMKIDGSKTVRVNNENQIIRLSGLVRQADVTANNMVDSKFILDAEIEYSGKGVVSDKQRPGWMVRVLDNVWPF